MNIFLRVDMNVLAFVLLLLVYFLAYRRLEKQDSLSKMFMTASGIILLQLFLETAACIINRRPERLWIPIANILHIILFSVAPIATCHWFLLINKIIYPKQEGFKKISIIICLPVAVNLILDILSPIYHFVFYIDSNNVYHRGWLYIPAISIAYFYIILALVFIAINRKNIPREDANILLVFMGFPIFGGLVQAFVYGPLLIWSCSAFSLIIVYIFLQQRMVHVDELTGAWDRGSFEYYLHNKLPLEQEGFGIIYCDIDHLKEINDSYGHIEGDFAIRTAVTLIREALREDDIIVRHGGDEFLVILKSPVKEELDHIIRRMEDIFEEYNKNSTKGYKLECSFGGDIFHKNYGSIDHFINYIDGIMYQNKNLKKSKEVLFVE